MGEPEPELRALFDRIHQLPSNLRSVPGATQRRDDAVWDLVRYLCPDRCDAALRGEKNRFNERTAVIDRAGSWLHGRLFRYLWLLKTKDRDGNVVSIEEHGVDMTRYETPSSRWRVQWHFETFHQILSKKKKAHGKNCRSEFGSEFVQSLIETLIGFCLCSRRRHRHPIDRVSVRPCAAVCQ